MVCLCDIDTLNQIYIESRFNNIGVDRNRILFTNLNNSKAPSKTRSPSPEHHASNKKIASVHDEPQGEIKEEIDLLFLHKYLKDMIGTLLMHSIHTMLTSDGVKVDKYEKYYNK